MPHPTLRTALSIGLALAAATGAPACAQTLNSLAYVQFVGHVPTATQLNVAKAIGVRNVRLAVRWYEVEKKKGVMTWGASDARILPVTRAGLTPMITIFGGNAAYEPGEDPARRSPPIDGEARDGFAAFSAATAKRYGVGVQGAQIVYEIWNEPNTKTFWSRPPEPEGYAAMALAACRAVKAAEPRAIVLGLAMEGTPVKSPYYVLSYGLDIYQQWADRAGTPELMDCLDGVSFHPYRAKPETYLDDEPALAAYLAKRWRKDTKPLIANTEWGHQINLRKGGDADRQAILNTRALLIGAGLKRRTNIYQAVDGGRDPDKPDQTYGVAEFNGALKPAGQALQRLLGAIGDYDVESVGPAQGATGLFRFVARKGSSLAMVFWTTSGEAPIKLSAEGLGPTTAAVDLIDGTASPIADGVVTVGEKPVMLVSNTSSEQPAGR